MNILFSSDDNYARHMGVAICSILLHNVNVEKIHFFVINNRISSINIDKLYSIIHDYNNADISFIPFEKFECHFHLDLAWPISLSSYARLLIGELLPVEIERVIYLDCDIVVNGSLIELWNSSLNGLVLGAIQDIMPTKSKVDIGMSPHQKYFNAGVLLIDLVKWRKLEVGDKCKAFIESHNGFVKHHDQGVLNGILKEQWKRLPLKYNVMTVHYVLSQSKLFRFYKDEAAYYDAKEVSTAIQYPIILHFTPSFTCRPWEIGCKHPLCNCYKDILDISPWKGHPLIRDNSSWYVHLINWRYRSLPII